MDRITDRREWINGYKYRATAKERECVKSYWLERYKAAIFPESLAESEMQLQY